jgi:UPF0755 protein
MTSRVIIIGVLCILVFFAGFTAWVFSSISPVSRSSEPVHVTIQPGEDAKTIAQNLAEHDLLRSPFAFRVYLWVEGLSSKLQAGVYDLAPSMSVAEIARILAYGQAQSNERTIRILEGWSNEEMGAYFEQEGVFSASAWRDAARTTDSRTILPNHTYTVIQGKPSTATLEGYLYPDTYRIFRDASPADVIQKMLENAETKFSAEIMARAGDTDFSFFETLILASIVEREVRSVTDQRKVADIFLKRLRDGIPLQSDATVNYVTGNYALRPTLEDLAVDSPYNTYAYRGLPPGPIGNPSVAVVNAVLDPESNPYYYFLTAESGETIFSRTLEEHNANKAKYLGR